MRSPVRIVNCVRIWNIWNYFVRRHLKKRFSNFAISEENYFIRRIFVRIKNKNDRRGYIKEFRIFGGKLFTFGLVTRHLKNFSQTYGLVIKSNRD